MNVNDLTPADIEVAGLTADVLELRSVLVGAFFGKATHADVAKVLADTRLPDEALT